MKIFITDLEIKEFETLFPSSLEDAVIISDDGSIKHCIGCFGCWIKTPGACVIRDNYGDMGEYFSKCKELIIISKCCYGGFSPFVKNVLDRSISYVHPYFEIRNGEMHHRRRYDNEIHMQVWFYGENITEKEKETAKKLIKANGINLSCNVRKITFNNTIEEMEEKIS
jgi:multimeric flavodoxin WrbA